MYCFYVSIVHLLQNRETEWEKNMRKIETESNWMSTYGFLPFVMLIHSHICSRRNTSFLISKPNWTIWSHQPHCTTHALFCFAICQKHCHSQKIIIKYNGKTRKWVQSSTLPLVHSSESPHMVYKCVFMNVRTVSYSLFYSYTTSKMLNVWNCNHMPLNVDPFQALKYAYMACVQCGLDKHVKYNVI